MNNLRSKLFTVLTLLLFVAQTLVVQAAIDHTDHYALLTGSACKTPAHTKTTYKVTSWNTADYTGSNDQVTVEMSYLADNQVSPIMVIATENFTETNDYQIDGIYTVTRSVDQITLRYTVLGTWGDGRSGGQTDTITVIPTNCVETPTVTPTQVNSPTPTITSTLLPTVTVTTTSLATATVTSSPTPTITATTKFTVTATVTPIPTNTLTSTTEITSTTIITIGVQITPVCCPANIPDSEEVNWNSKQFLPIIYK